MKNLERRHRKAGHKVAQSWLDGLSSSMRASLGRHVERSLIEQMSWVIKRAEDGEYQEETVEEGEG